ncbi:MAG: ATP-dependent Clp protease adaptor ClpS [Lachnospiraceae bacterium]|nr:ATP-dependent Clp protease adaptor ClpS [Lachnospiraceae bacterium]
MAAQGELKERTKNKIKEPKLYNVIMLNDDFTTMEFVVEILMDIFHKPRGEAEFLMLTVHKSGSAIVGSYPYDIASTKVAEALSRARASGFPFRMKISEA